jgi:hypothetical protein
MSKIVDVFVPAFIYFVIFIKILFILFSVSNLILKKTESKDKDKDKTKDKTKDKNSKSSFMTKEFVNKWRERTEFIFMVSMALLLIIVFNPWFKNEHHLNKEMKLLFYLFGWILIVTAKWGDFMKEAPWYKKIVRAWN